MLEIQSEGEEFDTADHHQVASEMASLLATPLMHLWLSGLTDILDIIDIGQSQICYQYVPILKKNNLGLKKTLQKKLLNYYILGEGACFSALVSLKTIKIHC